MGSLNNSVDTVNAAANAIVTAESRVRPPAVPKKRWGSWWSLYWCFGSHKNSKRIGHAVLVPEPAAPTGPAATVAPNSSTTTAMPFIAPPSSPASFLQSDPPSASHTPAGVLSLTSLSANAYSCSGPASIFTIGPYAYETQIVSPPVFSNFTTEPSTAPFTPPPESVQLTTPSSPEVPFAQLLASSLDRARRNSGGMQKFALYNYEFQPYQQYPGSPGAQLISPGSVISTSGTSTPYPERRPPMEFRKGETPKILGFEHFSSRKWGSRLGSGSLTPDGTGQGSRLGSGSLTPDGVGLASRLGSGCVTPDGPGQDSRLGSGSLTPQNQTSEVACLANSENGHQGNATVVDHRVSFELTGEDVARCLANKTGALLRNISRSSQGILAKDPVDMESSQKETVSCCEECSGKTNDKQESSLGDEQQCCQKHQSVSSSKEFNFDNRKGDVSGSASDVGKEGRSVRSWAFFPMLQPEIS